MKEKKTVEELLTTPSKSQDIKDLFKDIADQLIHNFCIKCGDKTFYFAEVEFYYYDKNIFNAKWNRETYPREKKGPGELFFHYSGVDVCFESVIDEDHNDVRFGGILIRSLYDIDNSIYITGPTVCANEILNNSSKSKIFPVISYLEGEKNNCEIPSPITRYGIDDEDLCFYDKRLKIKCSNKFKKWDMDQKNNGKNPGLKEFTRRYGRFKS